MKEAGARDLPGGGKEGIGHHVLIAVSAILVVLIVAIFHFRPANAGHEQTYLATSGVDTTANNPYTLTAANITALGASDANRYTDNANWPKNAGTFDESKYVEFSFTPSVPLGAVVQSVSITNVYSRTNTLSGAKLEVWDGATWSHSHALTIPAATNTDASDTIDVSSYLNTPGAVNSVKIRFLAYRNTNGNTKTNHNYINVHVAFRYAPTISSVDISPTDPPTNSVLTARVVAIDPDGEGLTTHYQWKKNGSNVGTDAETLDLSQAGNGDKGDQITVLASVDDGQGGAASKASDPVTVRNTAPVVTQKYASTSESAAVEIVLAGTDADNDPLVYHLVTPPFQGNVVISGDKAAYTPNPYCNGPDSFIFEADDGTEHSAHTLAKIDIIPVNYPPVAVGQGANTTEHAPVTIALPATDPDHDPLAFSIISPPANGALGDIFDGNKIVYTPTDHFFGTDTFVFKAEDTAHESSTATVTITVAEVNDAPVATDGSASGNEDESIPIAMHATDPKGTPLTFEIVEGPSHGALSAVTGNTVTYTAHQNYHGPDSFLFRASDGSLYSNTAEERMTVNPVNDPPTFATIHDATVDEGTLFDHTAVATDPDAEPGALRYSLSAAPSGTAIDAATGRITWTPSEAQGPGAYPMTVHVSDGDLATSTNFTLTVREVNVPPVADDISLETSADAPASFDLAGSDTDVPANTLTYVIVDYPRHGTTTRVGERGIQYVPLPGFEGTDSLIYLVNDGTTASDIAKVNISVRPGPEAPVVLHVSQKLPPPTVTGSPHTPPSGPGGASSTSPVTTTTSTSTSATGAATSSSSTVSHVDESWLSRAFDLMRRLKELLDDIAKLMTV